MKEFPDRLHFEDAGMHGGSRIFRLISRFRYHSSFGLITVPRTFETDGASIPRVFWNILSPFGDYFPAAVIHDFLYSPFNTEFDRAESDLIFREAMEHLGVPWFRRDLIYTAVRACGWICFKSRRSALS